MDNKKDLQEGYKSNFTADDFADKEVKEISYKGKPAKEILLSTGAIATIFEGTGEDVERATDEAGDDRRKYMSALIASVTLVDGAPSSMYSIGALPMKDYNRIQLIVIDLNF